MRRNIPCYEILKLFQHFTDCS